MKTGFFEVFLKGSGLIKKIAWMDEGGIQPGDNIYYIR